MTLWPIHTNISGAAYRRSWPEQQVRSSPRRKDMTNLAALTARIEKLEHDLGVQQDIHQIRRIQYTYGYFIDKSQYNEVVNLFAEDGDVWFNGGIYEGK